jgi:hypothetical protein
MVTVGNFLTPFLNFLCEWITGTRSQIIACSRESARWIFPNMHMQDWGYVGEVLLLARERNLAICRFAIASPQSPLKIQLFPVVPIFAEFAATCVLHWVGLWRAIPRG